MSDKRNVFYAWLSNLLKDKGWQIARSGMKLPVLNDNHQVNDATGYWANPTYSSAKPPRWLVAFDTMATPVIATVPDGHRSSRIGYGNTAQGNGVGIAVRIIPVLKLPDGSHRGYQSWEWNLLFLFPYPVPVGSSAETFDYDATTGVLTYKDAPVPYILEALIGLRDPADSADVDGINLTYGEATEALKSLLRMAPNGEEPREVAFHDLSAEDPANLEDLKRKITEAMAAAPPPPQRAGAEVVEEAEEEEVEEDLPIIEGDPELLGIDPGVYRQINAALRSGKQHIMFYGPPGTGKTTLARSVAAKLAGGEWNLITGSADWSSQDIIGGYQPVGNGEVAFIPGILLKNFRHPLIIDELNRCDIDKVLGPLFTVLSGQHTSLPYRTKVEDPESPSLVILPCPKANKAKHEFAPGIKWRLLATINSIDKASLYQMSYALSRRFGWIYVDAPADKKSFLRQYLKADFAPDNPCPLADIWDSINTVRVLGAAPFIDTIKSVLAMNPEADFFATPAGDMQAHLLDAFDMMLLPLLDGILQHDAGTLSDSLARHLALDPSHSSHERLKKRLLSVAL